MHKTRSVNTLLQSGEEIMGPYASLNIYMQVRADGDGDTVFSGVALGKVHGLRIKNLSPMIL